MVCRNELPLGLRSLATAPPEHRPIREHASTQSERCAGVPCRLDEQLSLLEEALEHDVLRDRVEHRLHSYPLDSHGPAEVGHRDRSVPAAKRDAAADGNDALG